MEPRLTQKIRMFHIFINLFILNLRCRGLSKSFLTFAHSSPPSYFMYYLFSFILISISPLSPSQSIILMAQYVSVYLYVLMQMGIVLYACIFKLYKYCVIEFHFVLLFFMSSAFKIHLCCYVYI